MQRRKTGNAGVIRSGQADVREWRPPNVQHPDEPAVEEETPDHLTAAQLAEIQQAAHEEGFEQGRTEGHAFGHREGLEEGRGALQDRLARLDAMVSALEKPFEQLDRQVEEEIVSLVINMVRQLIRREVKLDPGQIVGVVREALGILPVSSRGIRVMLHPEDAELVREAYTLGEHDQKWQIVEDPVIQRGGCRVHTDTSQVDATLDSRLNTLIAPLLAGERQADQLGGESGEGDARD